MTELWKDAWKLVNEPILKDFFSSDVPFPVNPSNYGNYKESFLTHFEAMKKILHSKEQSNMEIEDIQPDPVFPFAQELRYSSTSRPTSVPETHDSLTEVRPFMHKSEP